MGSGGSASDLDPRSRNGSGIGGACNAVPETCVRADACESKTGCSGNRSDEETAQQWVADTAVSRDASFESVGATTE